MKTIIQNAGPMMDGFPEFLKRGTDGKFSQLSWKRTLSSFINFSFRVCIHLYKLHDFEGVPEPEYAREKLLEPLEEGKQVTLEAVIDALKEGKLRFESIKSSFEIVNNKPSFLKELFLLCFGLFNPRWIEILKSYEEYAKPDILAPVGEALDKGIEESKISKALLTKPLNELAERYGDTPLYQVLLNLNESLREE